MIKVTFIRPAYQLLRAKGGARNPNRQVAITHASHLFVWTPTKNEWNAHRTHFDQERFGLLSIVIWSHVFYHLSGANLRKAQRWSKSVLDLRSLSPALSNHWLLLVFLKTFWRACWGSSSQPHIQQTGTLPTSKPGVGKIVIIICFSFWYFERKPIAYNIYIYYINTHEIPGKLSRKKTISSRLKRSPLLWLHNKSRLLHGLALIGVHIINKTVHGRLEIQNFSCLVLNNISLVRTRREIVSSRDHVIWIRIKHTCRCASYRIRSIVLKRIIFLYISCTVSFFS